jgi:hypothetical protein
VGATTLAVKSRKIEAFTVSIGIFCQRTQRALDDWKLKTHAAILQAYQKLLRDYEDKLAAAEVQAAQQIQGRNPRENEILIRTELKKGAISVFTAQHYDLFGAIAYSPQGFPQPKLGEAAEEGKYIRFFEQAFEWDQMQYVFYPYYWGRKQNWTVSAQLEDSDPIHMEFLKAGAARVAFSVREGFWPAVRHFLETGDVVFGFDDLTSESYLSINEELRGRLGAPQDEVPYGSPWDVRLPTTLVQVREDDRLPEWVRDETGTWRPRGPSR